MKSPDEYCFAVYSPPCEATFDALATIAVIYSIRFFLITLYKERKTIFLLLKIIVVSENVYFKIFT